MEKFTERPAVGTRVTLRKVRGDVWCSQFDGQSGVVVGETASTEGVYVQFGNGQRDCGEWSSLTPETPTAPLPEITLNGVRYVLAPEQEPEKAEEQREPKRGEIWRDLSGSEGFVLIVNGVRCLYVWLNSGTDGYHPLESFSTSGIFTFAYPSLAAAIEAGETFT